MKIPYGPLDVYLGTNIQKLWNPDADEDQPHFWSMSVNHYVKNIIANIEESLKNHGRQLHAKQQSPLTQGHRPDMDTSPELDGDTMSYYQENFGWL